MKKTYIYILGFLIIPFFYNCNNNYKKEDLVGSWFSSKSPKNSNIELYDIITFYPNDSVTTKIYCNGEEIQSYEGGSYTLDIDKNMIYIEFMSNKNYFRIKKLKKKTFELKDANNISISFQKIEI